MESGSSSSSSQRLTTPLFRSKKEAVFDSLRASIVNGMIRPGERLVIDELARTLGVSPIPVREALQHLQADGFVVIQPHVGATVTRIEPQLITEIFDLLESLELISGREACMRMSPEQFTYMESLLKQMDGLGSNLDAWSDANVLLHRFICECAGMPLVQSMLVKVLEHWRRLRALYMNDVFAHRVAGAQREHWAMFRAMKACDVARLEKIVHDHNRAARAAYTAHFKRALEEESQTS
jgi:DNA-binding GntR family transcriptional regulator